MESGLAGFKQLLREFKGISAWMIGGGLVVPFAAERASLSPPWPSGIVLLTAISELVVLMLVYQFLKSAKRRTINIVLVISAIVLATIGTVYVTMASLYIYEVPTTKERFVKGYLCTPEAATVFAQKCPDLGLTELSTANFEAEALWTRSSIAKVRIALVANWVSAFVALAVFMGSFIVYQVQVGKRNVRGRGATT
jgi:hypothetical protein